MYPKNFTNVFLEYIRPGHCVLDLGAGEGKFARMFVERGATVTEVDIHLSKTNDSKIISNQMSIEDFCLSENSDPFELIFARNCIQFLDKNWVFERLFPWMEEHITENGIIALETFYQEPEPLFEHPMKSLYTLKELQAFFLSWTEVLAREYSDVGLDMSGQRRRFFVSSIIVQKAK